MAVKDQTAKKDNTGAFVAAAALSGAAGVVIWSILKGKAAAGSQPRLLIANPVVYPGYNLNFIFSGFPPSVTVGVAAGTSLAVLVPSNEEGTGAGTFPIPPDTHAGNYTLVASVVVDEKTYSASAKFKVAIGAWYAMLTAIIESPSITALPALSHGWQPMLTTIVESVSIIALPALSQGWRPMLMAVVNSGSITALPALSLGWQPMLMAVVNSGIITALPALLVGWQPMLAAIVYSPTLMPLITKYSLSVSVYPSSNYGSVAVYADSLLKSAPYQIDAGALVQLVASASSGHIFEKWFDGGSQQYSNFNPLTFIMDANRIVYAYFIESISTKFSIGDTIQYDAGPTLYLIGNITVVGGILSYVVSSEFGTEYFSVATVDSDPEWHVWGPP